MRRLPTVPLPSCALRASRTSRALCSEMVSAAHPHVAVQHVLPSID
jgi:hypothetical protein